MQDLVCFKFLEDMAGIPYCCGPFEERIKERNGVQADECWLTGEWMAGKPFVIMSKEQSARIIMSFEYTSTHMTSGTHSLWSGHQWVMRRLVLKSFYLKHKTSNSNFKPHVLGNDVNLCLPNEVITFTWCHRCKIARIDSLSQNQYGCSSSGPGLGKRKVCCNLRRLAWELCVCVVLCTSTWKNIIWQIKELKQIKEKACSFIIGVLMCTVFMVTQLIIHDGHQVLAHYLDQLLMHSPYLCPHMKKLGTHPSKYLTASKDSFLYLYL